jgi:hypothetical protein
LQRRFICAPAATIPESKARANVSRTFRRLYAHRLIAKIPPPLTRHSYGRQVMGTSLYLREHHFPNVYPKNKPHNILCQTQRSHGKRIYPRSRRGFVKGEFPLALIPIRYAPAAARLLRARVRVPADSISP